MKRGGLRCPDENQKPRARVPAPHSCPRPAITRQRRGSLPSGRWYILSCCCGHVGRGLWSSSECAASGRKRLAAGSNTRGGILKTRSLLLLTFLTLTAVLITGCGDGHSVPIFSQM